MSDFPEHARAATEAIRGLFPETPLQRNDHLSARYGAEIWLKREDLTPVRSYKLRGAFNAMRKVRGSDPDQTNKKPRVSSVRPLATTRRASPSCAGNWASGAWCSCR